MWHSCGASNTYKQEKIQYRALKFVFNDFTSSYEVLLHKANLPTLELSRIRNIALEVFKAIHKLNPSFINNMFSDNVHTHSYNLRKDSLRHTHKRTRNYGLHSFNHVGVTVWNSLPGNIRICDNYKAFKALIKTWSGLKCKCAFCTFNQDS